MPSHNVVFTIGAGKRDKEAEIVFLRACRQQARDPDFVACLSGKGGRSSETNRWMGNLRLRQDSIFKEFYALLNVNAEYKLQ